MDRRHFLLALPASSLAASAASPPVVEFDGTAPGKRIRPLNGVNGGPLAAGGLLDLSARWKEAAFSLARLHDCHWPNPDVVDVHAVFPNPEADPARPENYDFERTDEYVQAVHACGAEIVYRLGESIEHQKAKRHAHPPKDPARWATVCAGIVRHYTQGWARGFKLPIRYWEIGNEPDNRPSCWTGTDEDYFRLYTTTALTLRKQFPAIKIGGPGVGNSGELQGNRLHATPFLTRFLRHCHKASAPLDFLSWHCYTSDPEELVHRARGVRAILDQASFRATESHLNEWNYLPGGTWNGMTSRDASVREKWYATINGPEGAAFVVSTLTVLQNAPLDVACYFTAEAPGMGLFSQHGVPARSFAAFLVFKDLVNLQRVSLRGEPPPGVTALAGLGDGIRVLLARTRGKGGPVDVCIHPTRWAGATRYEILAVDADHNLSLVRTGKVDGSTVRVDLASPSVCLVRLREDSKE